MFNFGQSSGVPIGVLETLDIPWIDVVPQTWQRWVRDYVGLGPNEIFSSCELALQCTKPEYHPLFKRSKDHNTADAYFLSLWGACHANDRKKASGGNSSQRNLPPLSRMIDDQIIRESKGRQLAASQQTHHLAGTSS